MRQRRFGDTDLHASEIAFGTWALGSDWWGETDDPDRLIGRALELGVTFFDTGDAYGQGRNEEIVGQALAGADRDAIQISTKFGYELDSERLRHAEGERPQNWSAEHAREALEASLRRLGTDHVDLYQLHNPRMEAIERDDLFAELEAMRDEGKLREYGVALGPAIGWRDEGVAALRERGVPALQTVYNLLEQEPGSDFLAAARRPAPESWRASRPRAGCSRTSTPPRRPSRATTIAATASVSGCSRGCRRSSGFASSSSRASGR